MVGVVTGVVIGRITLTVKIFLDKGRAVFEADD